MGNLSGLYSRRINCSIGSFIRYMQSFAEGGEEFDGTVKVVRMWTHYEGL